MDMSIKVFEEKN